MKKYDYAFGEKWEREPEYIRDRKYHEAIAEYENKMKDPIYLDQIAEESRKNKEKYNNQNEKTDAEIEFENEQIERKVLGDKEYERDKKIERLKKWNSQVNGKLDQQEINALEKIAAKEQKKPTLMDDYHAMISRWKDDQIEASRRGIAVADLLTERERKGN